MGEQNNNGTNILHIPDDSPLNSYDDGQPTLRELVDEIAHDGVITAVTGCFHNIGSYIFSDAGWGSDGPVW